LSSPTRIERASIQYQRALIVDNGNYGCVELLQIGVGLIKQFGHYASIRELTALYDTLATQTEILLMASALFLDEPNALERECRERPNFANFLGSIRFIRRLAEFALRDFRF
jgi:hypothetical protein